MTWGATIRLPGSSAWTTAMAAAVPEAKSRAAAAPSRRASRASGSR